MYKMIYSKRLLWVCLGLSGLWLASGSTAALGQFTVVSVSPQQHATTPPLNAPVEVTFSLPVDILSLTGATFRVFGHQSGWMSGAYSTDEVGVVARFQPDRPFKPGEIVSVVLTTQVLSSSGAALDAPFHWEFSARPAYGNGIFARPITSSSPYESVLYPSNTLRNPARIYAGDLTGDAYPELAIANSASASVTIMVNSRNRLLQIDDLYDQELVVSLDDNPLDITGGDLDGDGQLDLVVSNYTVNTITLLINQTNGGSVPSMLTQVVPTTERPFSVAVADLNGDGWQDIAVAGFGSDEVAVHLNAGSGLFPDFQVYPVGQAVADIVARDMDNDGAVDLIVASTGDRRIDILTNNGAGAFALAQSVALGYTPASISAFDFQGSINGNFGDTWADILVTAQDTALVTVLDHQGDPAQLTFSREDYPLAPSSQAYAHVLADFDTLPDGALGPDADLDVMLAHLSSNEMRVLLNTQADAFLQGQQFGQVDAGNTPLGITAGDFERDGDIDVAFVSATDNELRVLFNDDKRPADLTIVGDEPDFGDVYTCRDSTMSVTFRSLRFETITVTDITTNMDPPFSVNVPTPFDVEAGAEFTIEVTFDPVDAVVYNALLFIVTTDGIDTNVLEIDLVGRGIETDLVAEPADVSFGLVPVNDTGTQDVLITNNGNVMALVDSIVVSDPVNFGASFAGQQMTSIVEGGSETLTATFTPQAIGDYTATITLYINDPCNPTLVIPVAGTGISPLPDLIADSLWASAYNVVAGDVVQLTGQLDAGSIPPGAPTQVQFSNDEGDLPISQTIGADVTGLSQYTASMQLDTPGLRTITFTVDASDAVIEADETNNTYSIQINVTPAPLPDLIAADLTLSSPTVSFGQTVTFDGLLSVDNAEVVQASSVSFEVDGAVHSTDTALPVIAVGEQVAFPSTAFLPTRLGDHQVTFRVDADAEIDEVDEANNEITVSFEVVRGDLVVTPNPFTPNNDGTNEEVNVDFTSLALNDPTLLIYTFEGALIREVTEANGNVLSWDGRDDQDRGRDPGLYLFVLMEGGGVVDSGHITLAR